MFQFRTVTAAAKGAFAALALGGAMLAAAPASAANLTLLKAEMDQTNTAIIQGAFYPNGVNAYIGPVTFTANAGGDNFSFMAFCIDIYHDMYLGQLNVNGLDDNPVHPGVPGYFYHDESVFSDSSASSLAGQDGTALTQFQLNQMSSLLNYADYLVKHTSATTLRSRQLAGIQGAIWKVINPTYTVDGSDGFQNVDYWTSTYLADAAVASYMPVGQMKAIFANDYNHQAFAIALGVPEPATWALMIVGFGSVGLVLRRRRSVALAA